MKRYIIPDRQIMESGTSRYLTDDVLIKVIGENNEGWTMFHDVVAQGFIIECESKPRDLPIYGLKWLGIPKESLFTPTPVVF